jgi:hypothetical protein
MTVSVNYTSKLETGETLPIATHLTTAANAVTAALTTTLVAQGAASSPACTKRGGADFALTAGAGTIDLTALTGTNGVSVDGTGLRVQFAKFLNPATNGNPITVKKGVTNGYDGFGAAFLIILTPGAEAMIRLNDAGSDIGSSNKTIDLVGTLVQPLSYEIVVG